MTELYARGTIFRRYGQSITLPDRDLLSLMDLVINSLGQNLKINFKQNCPFFAPAK